MVGNGITNFTPRISLSTPRVTPRDANKPSGKREVVLVNMFVSVSIHTQKKSAKSTTNEVDRPHL